jgi:exopolysaccharide production protein ExoZ
LLVLKSNSRNIAAPRLTYLTLDAWRGIASLGVVLHHACIPMIAVRFPNLQHDLLYSVILKGSLGVQIFFVISGFCVANAAVRCYSSASPLEFIVARIRRIYPPYFVASLVAAFLALMAQVLQQRGIIGYSALAANSPLGRRPTYYIAAFTMTQVPFGEPPLITIFWTLCYEIAFYFVMFLALQAASFKRTHSQKLLNLLNSITVCNLAVLVFKPDAIRFPFDLWPQFGLGILVFDLLAFKGRIRQILWTSLVAILFLSYAVLQTDQGSLSHVSIRLQSAICLLFSVLLLILFRFDAYLSKLASVRLLSFVGIFSYSLYLIHIPALGIVSQIFRKANVTEHTFVYVWVVQVLVSVPCGYVFYRVAERPFLNSRRKRQTAEMPPVPSLA